MPLPGDLPEDKDAALAGLSRPVLEARLHSGRPVTFTTQGVSMVPFLRAGDRVRLIATGRPRLGDVIAFWRGEELVVHRFAGWAAGGTLFREKGDNLREWHLVPAGDLAGRVDQVGRQGVDRACPRSLPRGLWALAFCLAYPRLRRLWHLLRRKP